MVGSNPRVIQASLDGKIRKAHLQFSATKPFFVDGKQDLVIFNQCRARIVSVPYPENIHVYAFSRRFSVHRENCLQFVSIVPKAAGLAMETTFQKVFGLA